MFQSSLSKLISTFAGEVCSRANTENDLWYALRLVVPLLQRCYDWREKVKHEEVSCSSCLVSLCFVLSKLKRLRPKFFSR